MARTSSNVSYADRDTSNVIKFAYVNFKVDASLKTDCFCCAFKLEETETVLFYVNTATTHKAPKNEQPDVSRDLQRLMNCSAVGLDVFNNPSFATSLRPIAMKLLYAPCSSVFSQSGLIMRPSWSRLSLENVSVLALQGLGLSFGQKSDFSVGLVLLQESLGLVR